MMNSINNFFAKVLDPKILWLIFGSVFFIVLIITIVLIYHWRIYSLAHHKHLATAEKWYLIITAILFIIAGSILVFYTSSFNQ